MTELEEGEDEALAADVRGAAAQFLASLGGARRTKTQVTRPEAAVESEDDAGATASALDAFWEQREVFRGERKARKAVVEPTPPSKSKAEKLYEKRQRLRAAAKEAKAVAAAAKAGKASRATSTSTKKTRGGLFSADGDMWEDDDE